MAAPDGVLDFWFGPDRNDLSAIDERRAVWFKADAGFDEAVREQFAETVWRARSGALDAWTLTPHGRLALIIVLDQFTRNIHRGNARAFENDTRALPLSVDGVEQRADESLNLFERAFFYMPLMHSELIEDQDRAVACYERLVVETTPLWQRRAREFLRHAVAHREVIVRFERFPHRNRVLGRASTAAERAYLSGGSAFGQA